MWRDRYQTLPTGESGADSGISVTAQSSYGVQTVPKLKEPFSLCKNTDIKQAVIPVFHLQSLTNKTAVHQV